MRVVLVEVPQFPDRARLQVAYDRGVGQVPAVRHGVEVRRRHAPGDGRVIDRVERSGLRLRQKAVVLRLQEPGKHSADHHLVVVQAADFLDPVIAHVADVEQDVLVAVLHADVPLLHVGGGQARVGHGHCVRRGGQRVVLRQGPRHLEGGDRKGRRSAADEALQAGIGDRGRKTGVRAHRAVAQGIGQVVVHED